jgi:hypothetical protein
MTDHYDAQASRFLSDHGITFAVERSVNQTQCPQWCDPKEPHHSHGDVYVVTLTGRRGRHRRTIQFPYWASLRAKEEGLPPSAYDVLASLSGDSECPDTFEEFCTEYGYDTDSRQAEAVFNRCRPFALRLRAFFSPDELAALREIR